MNEKTESTGMTEKLKMEDTELVENALIHLTQAAGFFSEAGFDATGKAILEFAITGLNTLSNEMGDLQKLQDATGKLSTEEYDSILADIFKIGT